MKFGFDTDSIEWRELVPRQRIGDCSEIHVLRGGCCALLLSSHKLFCSQNRFPLVFAEASMNTVLPLFVSPLLKHHLQNLSSLFQRNVRAHAPPDPLV